MDQRVEQLMLLRARARKEDDARAMVALSTALSRMGVFVTDVDGGQRFWLDERARRAEAAGAEGRELVEGMKLDPVNGERFLLA